MAAGTKRTRSSRRVPLGFSEIETHGAHDIAVLGRTMVDGWADDPDPLVSVYLQLSKSILHPGDREPENPRIDFIRLSGLEMLISDLGSAIETGRRTGALPPPMTEEQWRTLYKIEEVTQPTEPT